MFDYKKAKELSAQAKNALKKVKRNDVPTAQGGLKEMLWQIAANAIDNQLSDEQKGQWYGGDDYCKGSKTYLEYATKAMVDSKIKNLKGELLFARNLKNGDSLECLVINDAITFWRAGERLDKKSLVGYVSLDECLQKKYLSQAQHDEIKQSGFNHLWNLQVALTDDELTTIQMREKQLQEAEKVHIAKRVNIHLSSRGWGDFESLVWQGSIDMSDDDILAECKQLFDTGHAVDLPYNADQVRAKIAEMRKAYADQSNGAQKEQAHQEAKKVIEGTSEKVKALHKKCCELAIKNYKLHEFAGNQPVYEYLADGHDHPLYWQVKAYDEALSILQQ